MMTHLQWPVTERVVSRKEKYVDHLSQESCVINLKPLLFRKNVYMWRKSDSLQQLFTHDKFEQKLYSHGMLKTFY